VSGQFLAEGAPAVREALKRADAVLELFGTRDGLTQHSDLVDLAQANSVPVAEISDKAAAGLSETVSPQGLIAVCTFIDRPLKDVLSERPRLVVILVDANEPGNAGAILRSADAVGADAVILAGDSVDLYNGKLVRATAGSLFHLDVVVGTDPVAAISSCRAAGLLTLATTGDGEEDLDDLVDKRRLAGPTAWVFGNEARGLPVELIKSADLGVRIPIRGHAESLNLAAAAAVCLYSSGREQSR
jgi:TrmH family RNA methyltransferase